MKTLVFINPCFTCMILGIEIFKYATRYLILFSSKDLQ